MKESFHVVWTEVSGIISSPHLLLQKFNEHNIQQFQLTLSESLRDKTAR